MGKEGTEDIEDFIKKAREKFNPELILLFGSRARNEHLRSSDYDILIVSSQFEGVHFLDRISALLELWDYDWDVDLLPYTPEEFEEKKREIGIVSEAVREGIRI